MGHHLIDLPWLPAAPTDIREVCRSIDPADPVIAERIRFLATHRLGAAGAAALSRAIERCLKITDLSPLSSFRLAVLSNATTDLIADFLPSAAARHGVALDIVRTLYGQVMQQILDPDSILRRLRLDAILVALDHRWMRLDRIDLKLQPTYRITDAVERLRNVVDMIANNLQAPSILSTLAVPPASLFGSFERRVNDSPRRLIEEMNYRIVELAAQTGSYVFDTAALAERVGTDHWFDPVQWYAYKLPFSACYNEIYAEMLARHLGAIRGHTKKCLVLDLDNTVWGGVVGEDGINNLVLGTGNAAGEAFWAVQQMALDLRERGVLLAISSRNDDTIAREVLRAHKDMLLREEHIAVFQANWLDKASNLESIATTLNIGVDSLVLLDDNPAERAHVRAALPAVGIPELPPDPSWFPWYLLAAGYFETVAFSEEDRTRAGSYAADARRAEVMARVRNLGEYLQSLEMVLRASPFDAPGRARITQLINKTNQFNLTTQRYTEAEIEALEAAPNVFTLQVRLRDRFGDLGMIAVAICKPHRGDDSVWEIDTWLMSCRALGRDVEEAMLNQLVAGASGSNVHTLIGVYRPTAKNDMVRDHYKKLGFALLKETNGGDGYYELSLAHFQPKILSLTVEDHESSLLRS